MSIGDLRVLVAEDNGFLRWTVGNALERLGVEHVSLAENGAAALEMLREARTPIDVIVTDLDMPAMDGIELIRHLGAARCAASVVVLSALDCRVLATVEAMARCCGVHVVASVEKPVRAQALREALDAHERRRAQAAPVGAQPAGPLAMHVVAGEGSDAARTALLAREKLAHALLACRDRRRAGLEATVSVAIPLPCMQDRRFAHELHDALVALSLEPHHVALHLDEMPSPAALAAVVENAARLRMKGFPLVLPYRLRYGFESPFAAPPAPAHRASFSRSCASATGLAM